MFSTTAPQPLPTLNHEPLPLSSTAGNERKLDPGGEDTAHISFYCEWLDKSALYSLNEAKLIAQQPRERREGDKRTADTPDADEAFS